MGILLSKSKIYKPRNALAPASLPNLRYNFPKQKYKIIKSKRKYKWDRELYISLRFLYLEIEIKQNGIHYSSRCMSLEYGNFKSPEEYHTTEPQNLSVMQRNLH
jgi:hypothetical protein